MPDPSDLQPDFPVLSLRMLNCEANYQEASGILFGAPYDGTASFRPGSRFGPPAMRQDSIGLESYSPYQDTELSPEKIRDIGDLELPMGSRGAALKRIGATVRKILADHKKPIMLGGEHLVTLPAVEACLEFWPDLCVLHFDAHADLRDDYLQETLSHATVMRRIWDLAGDKRIWQLGIRSGTPDEFSFARAGHVNMHRFDLKGLETAIQEIDGRPVYLTIDLDVLDPSVFPGTGTPEPGGVDFKTMLQALLELKCLNIVGADLVELAPQYDASGVSTAVALKLMRELLILI